MFTVPIDFANTIRITSAEMRFIRRTAKYTWQDYKTNENILSESKINPVVNKILNYRNKWFEKCSANGQRQTATLNCEISIVWGTKPTTTPQKACRLNGTGRSHEA